MIDEHTYKLAAKRAGKEIHHFTPEGIPVIVRQLEDGGTVTNIWNPARDARQALQLALECGISIRPLFSTVHLESENFVDHVNHTVDSICKSIVELAARQQELHEFLEENR